MATKLIPVKAIEHLITREVTTIDGATYGINGFEIAIQDTLSLKDAMMFVDNVITNVVDIDDGEYRPELLDFLINVQILTGYANFRLPADIMKQYEFVENNHAIISVVKEYINKNQMDELIRAINHGIEHRLQLMYSSLKYNIDDLTEKMDRIIDYADVVFNDENADIIKSIGSMPDFNEEKIINAILDSN